MAGETKFTDLCKLLDGIESAPKGVLKEQKLLQFYKDYRKKGAEIKKNDASADISFYPVLRLLLPHLERERPVFGFNKFRLKNILARVLGVSKDAADFKQLSSGTSNFAEVAYGILRKTFYKSKCLNLLEINKHLDFIAEKQQDNQVAHQESAFLKLFQATSPEEQKWIIRIILKDMSLGLSETKILNAFHPRAWLLLNNTNSLVTVCNTLYDPSVDVNTSEITLFTPIRPMLSKRCDAKELYKSVVDTKPFIVETKFDGERFQLHMEDHHFKYFSRRGFDFTKKFGESYDVGLYTPLLKGVFNSDVKSVILDGEMMGWNKTTKKFGSKGMSFDVKNLSETSVHQACFCVYDIVFLNGEILSNKPLRERLNALQDIFEPREGVILHSKRTEVSTKQDIVKALNESMDNEEEGIVYKDLSSLYIPNNRNGGWWKMKLEYFSGVMSDLDVIIMGGFFGKNKKVAAVIVGVSVPPETGDVPKKYLSLAKITTGLTSEEWNEIDKRLGCHWVKTKDNNYDSYGLEFGKVLPDVWIPPEKSCILLIRATELTKVHKPNSDFKTSYSLRFARVERTRFDKPYYDCLSVTELEDLGAPSKHITKLYNKHLSLDDIACEVTNTKKYRAKFADTNVEVEDKVSDILKCYEFCVFSGTAEWKVEEIEKTIKENGGNIVKTEGKNTYCILVGEWHNRLDYYKGSVDVVKVEWLQKVLDYRKVYPYRPEDMIYTTPKTDLKFKRNYDKYGDSYTENATKYSLEKVFNKIKEKDDYVCPLSNEIEELHKDIGFDKRLNLFRDYVVYFDKFEVINDPTSEVIYDSVFDELLLKFWGGRAVHTLDSTVNTVITDSENISRKEEILRYIPGSTPVNIMERVFFLEKLKHT